MSSELRKIINDPVHGFITIDDPLVFEIISHPWYQRLRRIHQMAFASLVYPGAVHTRLHHSLGAYHLMCIALNELTSKGIDISPEEKQAAKLAILLHDIGHGPYSHALEQTLIEGVHHEDISLLIMEQLNEQVGGRLSLAIRIFRNDYEKRFLHQLLSGQVDVDRMDYLTRDSFFTGVSEGVIGYDRILKMLTTHNGELVVEEKALYSIEKFLVSRRLMYWQVYLHKTVLSAEMMLVKIIKRAKELIAAGDPMSCASTALYFFLHAADKSPRFIRDNLDQFCLLDDYDVLTQIKNWISHEDKILSLLCRRLINRQLFKVKFQSIPFTEAEVLEKKRAVTRSTGFGTEQQDYLVFTGEAINTTYNPKEERINILFKDKSLRNISEVDNALIHHNLSSPVKKFYICYLSV